MTAVDVASTAEKCDSDVAKMMTVTALSRPLFASAAASSAGRRLRRGREGGRGEGAPKTAGAALGGPTYGFALTATARAWYTPPGRPVNTARASPVQPAWFEERDKIGLRSPFLRTAAAAAATTSCSST